MVHNRRRDQGLGVFCFHAHLTGEIDITSAMTIFLVFSMKGLAAQDEDLLSHFVRGFHILTFHPRHLDEFVR